MICQSKLLHNYSHTFYKLLQLPVGEKEEEEEEEEVEGGGEGDPEEAEAGSSASTHKTVSVASVKTSARGLKRCRTPKLDEALIKFLSKPRDSETVAKKVCDPQNSNDIIQKNHTLLRPTCNDRYLLFRI